MSLNTIKVKPRKIFLFCLSFGVLSLFLFVKDIQEGSKDLQKGYPSVTKGASSSAKHPSGTLHEGLKGASPSEGFKGA